MINFKELLFVAIGGCVLGGAVLLNIDSILTTIEKSNACDKNKTACQSLTILERHAVKYTPKARQQTKPNCLTAPATCILTS